MAPINRPWLVKEILQTLTPSTVSMARFFSKLDSAIKVSITPQDLTQAIYFDLSAQNAGEVAFWNPLLATLVWVEGVLPSQHPAIFCDADTKKILESSSVFPVPFGILAEMDLDTKKYVLHFINKPLNILHVPMVSEIYLKEDLGEKIINWQLCQSHHFEEEFWQQELIRPLIPIAENSLASVTSLFMGILALIGGVDLSNWETFNLVKN